MPTYEMLCETLIEKNEFIENLRKKIADLEFEIEELYEIVPSKIIEENKELKNEIKHLKSIETNDSTKTISSMLQIMFATRNEICRFYNEEHKIWEEPSENQLIVLPNETGFLKNKWYISGDAVFFKFKTTPKAEISCISFFTAYKNYDFVVGNFNNGWVWSNKKESIRTFIKQNPPLYIHTDDMEGW